MEKIARSIDQKELAENQFGQIFLMYNNPIELSAEIFIKDINDILKMPSTHHPSLLEIKIKL